MRQGAVRIRLFQQNCKEQVHKGSPECMKKKNLKYQNVHPCFIVLNFTSNFNDSGLI